MWRWLKRRFLGPLWRLEHEARIELAEARLADLNARFTRFLNRENMRLARSGADRDKQLELEAAELLAGTESAPAEVKASSDAEAKAAKAALWQKARRH